MKFVSSIGRPGKYGAHALALTPQNRLVLVRLRYAPGWRLPGGGRGKDEDPTLAGLRELREEIGMTSHGAVQLAGDFDDPVNSKRGMASLVIVRDVRYRPRRWSMEVEAVCEADPNDLPAGTSRLSAHWIDLLRPIL